MEFDIYSMIMLGLGLSIPFSLWWLYFDSVDGAPIRAVPEKGKIGVYSLWLFGHFPLVVAITSVGVGIRHIVSSIPGLTLSYSEQWLVCGSVALSLGAQGILHLSSAYYYFYSGSTRNYYVSRRWAIYRIVSAGVILLIPILSIQMSPFLLVCILAPFVFTNNYRFKTTSLSSSSSLEINHKMSTTAIHHLCGFCKCCPRQQLVSVRNSQNTRGRRVSRLQRYCHT